MSGVGWHSSGAYLLRTPLNALISGCIDVIVGYVGSFLLLNAFLTVKRIYIFPTDCFNLLYYAENFEVLSQCFAATPIRNILFHLIALS